MINKVTKYTKINRVNQKIRMYQKKKRTKFYHIAPFSQYIKFVAKGMVR